MHELINPLMTEGCDAVIPIVQVRKLRLRKVEHLPQGHEISVGLTIGI